MRISPELEWVPADEELLRQLLEADPVATEIPAPGFVDYLLGLGSVFFGWLGDWIGERVSVGFLETIYWFLGAGLVLLLVLIAGFLARRWWLLWRDRAVAQSVRRSVPDPVAGLARSAEEWRREFENRIERGAIGPALEALWWWVACRLSPRDLADSWTTDELLMAVGGGGTLSPLLRALDRMLYGARPPRRDDVEQLATRLGRSLERSPS